MSSRKSKSRLVPALHGAEESKRFIETARKLGVDESEEDHERAFGKVELKMQKREQEDK